MIVEQVFGWLKARFQVLKKTLKYTPRKAAKFFLCCVILNNMIYDFRKSAVILPIVPQSLPEQAQFPNPREFRAEIIRQYC